MSIESTYIADANFYSTNEGLGYLAKYGSDGVAVYTLICSFLTKNENSVVTDADLTTISFLLRVEVSRVLEIVEYLISTVKVLIRCDSSICSPKIIEDKANLNKKRATYSNNRKNGSNNSATIVELPPNNGSTIVEPLLNNGQSIDKQSLNQSIQNNRITEDQNNRIKNSENPEIPKKAYPGRTCFYDRIHLSEEEIDLVKMALTKVGLQHDDFDLAVFNASNYILGKELNYPPEKHFQLVTGSINLKGVQDLKNGKKVGEKINSPPGRAQIDFIALTKTKK